MRRLILLRKHLVFKKMKKEGHYRKIKKYS